MGAWLDAIEAELAAVCQAEGWRDRMALRTVYVGGGTPSLLGTGAMGALRARLERFAHLDDVEEWTAEANPESLTEELARDWRASGVDRISLGVQSFHEPALRWMGRLHGADGPGRAVAAARAAGIENISVDLIFALPLHLGRDWRKDLERAVSLEPLHISLYGLTAEEGAPLGRWVREGRESLPTEGPYAEEFLVAAERLAGAGFHHYEVSNFARPGHESRHNRVYWEGSAYLGLGPGAHSYLPPRRSWNERDWQAYRVAVAAGGRATVAEELVEGDAARLEYIWLRLRTAQGLEDGDWTPAQERLVRMWRQEGWVDREEGVVRLTPRGWLLLDRIAVDLEGAA